MLNNCLTTPEEYQSTTNLTTTTKSSFKSVSLPIPNQDRPTLQTNPTDQQKPKLPRHLVQRLGPNRIFNEESFTPTTANILQTPTLLEKRVKDPSEYYKARTQYRGRQGKGTQSTKKNQPVAPLSHHTLYHGNSTSPPPPQFFPQRCYQTDPTNHTNKHIYHKDWSDNPLNQQHLPLHTQLPCVQPNPEPTASIFIVPPLEPKPTTTTKLRIQKRLP